MPVFLCIPPVSSLVPYPAIPYLTSSLKANNQKVSTFDLNIKAFNLTLFHKASILNPEKFYVKMTMRASEKWAKSS